MNEEPQEEKATLVLTPVEARVLACLVEKEITTPEYYPLSLNSLKAACNQKSNRDPIMQLDEQTIQSALDELRYGYHFVWYTRQAGSRVAKYQHAIRDRFEFSPRELAVLTELMLRGPQTAGELRTHGRRLAEFETLAQVQETVDGLMHWGDHKFVTRLPSGPGRREPRYAHLLCGEEALPDIAESAPAAPVVAPGRATALEQEVAALRSELTSLREAFEAFRKQLGE